MNHRMEGTHSARYPRLAVSLSTIEDNTAALTSLCRDRGIRVTGVVKGIGAQIPVAAAMVRGGCTTLATSRLEHLLSLRQASTDPGSGIPADIELGMLRVPSPTEIADVVALADWSLQSDPTALELTARAVRVHTTSGTVLPGKNNRHGVVLMVDLGDLREGWFDHDEAYEEALRVERSMPELYLLGVGTNLGCYGSVLPDADNLGRLVTLARRIESAIDRPLDVVSGGATSSIRALREGTMPDGITGLRIGEGILTARDLPHFHAIEVPGVLSDALTLEAEVIEIRTKPSMPVGSRLVDAFGNVVVYENRGEQARLLLNAGKRDFGSHDLLLPLDPRIRVIGSSSDHLICELDCQFPPDFIPGHPSADVAIAGTSPAVTSNDASQTASQDSLPPVIGYGSVLRFGLLYGAMLFLSDDNPYVSVVYVD